MHVLCYKQQKISLWSQEEHDDKAEKEEEGGEREENNRKNCRRSRSSELYWIAIAPISIGHYMSNVFNG